MTFGWQNPDIEQETESCGFRLIFILHFLNLSYLTNGGFKAEVTTLPGANW